MRTVTLPFLALAIGLAVLSMAQAENPAPPPVAAGTTAAVQPQPDMNAADAAEDKFLREQGYKPEMRKGTRYYCRRQTVMGTRFEQTVCTTAEQSRDVRQHSKEMIEHAQRAQGNPIKG